MNANDNRKPQAARREWIFAAIAASVAGVLAVLVVSYATVWLTRFVDTTPFVHQAIKSGTIRTDELYDSDFNQSWRLTRDCEVIQMTIAKRAIVKNFVFAPRIAKIDADFLNACEILRDQSSGTPIQEYKQKTSLAQVPALRAALATGFIFIKPELQRLLWVGAASASLLFMLLRAWLALNSKKRLRLFFALSGFAGAGLALSAMSLSAAPALCAIGIGVGINFSPPTVRLKRLLIKGMLAGGFGALMAAMDYYSGAAIAGFLLLILCALGAGRAAGPARLWSASCYVVGFVVAVGTMYIASLIVRGIDMSIYLAQTLTWLGQHMPWAFNGDERVIVLAWRRSTDFLVDGGGVRGALLFACVMIVFFCAPLWSAGTFAAAGRPIRTLRYLGFGLVSLMLWGLFDLRHIATGVREYGLVAAALIGIASWILLEFVHSLSVWRTSALQHEKLSEWSNA